MIFGENPVLQRELLSNLRSPRAFVLLGSYLLLLGGLVYLAWPQDRRIDVTHTEASRRLVDLFFLGQFVLVALMAPSFAAGSITGEKERQTYEMLLASPLTPRAIVAGKLLASLCHLGLLVVASLPIVMLCLPLGGVSLYEVLAAYLALMMSTLTFGMISIAASAYFTRTFAALVVSYLLILPLAMLGALFWTGLGSSAALRLVVMATLLPLVCVAVTALLYRLVRERLLYPPDVGSEGKQVVDEEQEMHEAVGLVIQRGQFPDVLFAPTKRSDLLEDGSNPVFDKELRSEIFSQGTLMLRIVIQMSILLAVPAMWVFLYMRPNLAPWYASYVLLFNVMVGPVFSAGSVTGERERETLDLLLTTILAPWTILWPKLVSGLRVSSVLTLFLVWPLALACFLVPQLLVNWTSIVGYLLIVLLTCLTTANVALFSSVVFRKTATSLIVTYMVLLALFAAPVLAERFAEVFLPRSPAAAGIHAATLTSPFAAAFALPLSFEVDIEIGLMPRRADWPLVWSYVAFTALGNAALLGVMAWLFNTRWRVAQ